MKLRVKNNSIRLRLTQSEVAKFQETELVEESIEFAAGEKLVYALAATDIARISSIFADGKITVNIPRAEALRWATSGQVGIEADLDIGQGKTLRILVEKDFACIERRDGEDDSDAFPHPGSKSC